MDNAPATDSLKRKRSPSASAPVVAPVAKASKMTTVGGTGISLSINYLARQSSEDLPLLNKDDSLPNLLTLLSQYSNVLDRHESLASNLGARPLGPILIKRFERCFDAPPRVVASHHKGATTHPDDVAHHITWLEVIEFARSHPSQFTLSTFSEGRRVCQFYYPQKQLRVQISEEDFLFINSGRCQELIPPLPIWEDEEKEVGACDVLEAKLKELTNTADMVAARTRQLSHRLKGRRAAILERRAEGGSGTPAKASAPQTTTAPPATSQSGFVALNIANGRINGDSDAGNGSFATVRSELLRHFESLPHNQNHGHSQSRHQSVAGVPDGAHASRVSEAAPIELASTGGGPASTASSLSPVPPNLPSHDVLSYYTSDAAPAARQTGNAGGSGHRPSSSGGAGSLAGLASSKHNFSRPLPPALESSQPFRPLCQAHMDSLPRGHRVMPPCDRCRRLRMDCVKNLTSCAGCTKKHARCHWRDVSRDEVGTLDHLMETAYPDTAAMFRSPTQGASHTAGYRYLGAGGEQVEGYGNNESDDDDSNPLEDLEALGEKEDCENEMEARLREDEEGLRQAKELARQGWEGGLTMSKPAEATDQASAAAEPDNDIAAHPSHLTSTSEAAHGLTTTSPHSLDLKPPISLPGAQETLSHHATTHISSDDPARSLTTEQVSKVEAVPSHGGFRAVNDAIGSDEKGTVV